jgi:hypothetical protein
VVNLVALGRVEQPGRNINPDASVALPEVVREEAIGHEMKEMNLHLYYLLRTS